MENRKPSDDPDAQKFKECGGAGSDNPSKISEFSGKFSAKSTGANHLAGINNTEDVKSGQSLNHKNEMDQTDLISCRHVWKENTLEFEVRYMSNELSKYNEDEEWYDGNGAEEVKLDLPDPFDSWWDELEIESP
ncbi:hypothetical protein OTU49_010021 [Cherax quadricarinatus]|uniref:Uncharacterized protein n=4 Tax=Cherax quadricarinatus TaxID=27406 RepID=A0AAW0Y4G1_CHEQU